MIGGRVVGLDPIPLPVDVKLRNARIASNRDGSKSRDVPYPRASSPHSTTHADRLGR
jgi:hypothetical protein